ncbi:MAG: methyl-accepting chemotaxis protein [Pseudomonadota bacterium]
MNRDVRLGTKIIGGFSLILLLLVVVAGVGFTGLTRVVDQMNNADDTGRLIMMMYESRQQEKNFILRSDQSYVTAVTKQVDLIRDKAREIRAKSDDSRTVLQIDTMGKSVDGYRQAFDSYVSLEKNVVEADSAMVAAARQLEQSADTILKTNRTEYQKLMETGADLTTIKALMQNAEDAETIIRMVLQCRRHEKNFLIRKDESYFKRVNGIIDDIIGLAGRMRDRFQKGAEKEGAEIIIASARAYQAALAGMRTDSSQVISASDAYRVAFAGLKGLKDSQKNVENTMVTAAREVQEIVRTAMDYQKQKTDRQITTAKRFIIGVTLLACALGIGAALVITRGITRPLRRIIHDIAKGDLTSRLEVRGQDEVGELAQGFNSLIATFRDILKKISSDSAVIDTLSRELAAIAAELSSGSAGTVAMAGNVSVATGEMTANMNSVAAAMEQSSTSTGMVASAAEEMTATINQIAQNAERARAVSEDAVTQTRQSTEKMAQLDKATQSINRVTETITDISDQINLLALNATIEAARAGAAGKGFAVVAEEIKVLARETSLASLDISSQIKHIQDTIRLTVTDIDRTSAVINGVNENVVSIAGAIEEQSATTREIADTIIQVSRGIEDVNRHTARNASIAGTIAKDIVQVHTMADGTNANSSRLKTCAIQLQEMVTQLSGIIGEFRI